MRRNEIAMALAIGVVVLSASDPVFAQAAGGNVFQPINNVMTQVLAFMTGTFATTAATISVAALGYLMLTGNPHWRWAFGIVVGIAFIFGAATIVQVLQSTSSNGG
ncbi:type IV secretion system protein VirB2 [Rhizobiales bacterium GAS113]|nr:type IV secretion system protein VirB2 [Rhizobiales bacterium GAS113]